MKKYTTPAVEVKTFATVNKIADVSAWLASEEGKLVGAAGITADAITSYTIAS